MPDASGGVFVYTGFVNSEHRAISVWTKKPTLSGIPIDEPLANIIAQMPGWTNAQALAVQPLGGLTNTNYLVTVDGKKFMLLFFTAMWGLLQCGMQREGLVPVPDGSDCFEYAQETFAVMRELLR
jgi:hypothetical protein